MEAASASAAAANLTTTAAREPLEHVTMASAIAGAEPTEQRQRQRADVASDAARAAALELAFFFWRACSCTPPSR